jgi:octaprenyl-diphosphate synthase
MQTRHRGNLQLTEEEYFSIIDGKTAELCAVSCEIGARYAGAEDRVVAAMERYGRKLGLAFQIADDVLDLTGLEASIGKTLGTDLAQQKLTLPMIRLLQGSSPPVRETLQLQLEEGSEASIRGLLRQAQESGVIEEALETARRFAREAQQELEVLAPSPARELLSQLPTMSIERSC